MKNLAPEIFRQRLLMEGYYSADVTREFLDDFLPLVDSSSHCSS